MNVLFRFGLDNKTKLYQIMGPIAIYLGVSSYVDEDEDECNTGEK